jgi:LytS/YehU family sensor histidine kinase
MKAALYFWLAVGLIPVQTTVLGHLSVAGVRPDLCLIAVGLIGFFGGPADGVLMGALLGFEQDLFSAGEAWVNVITKTVIGLSGGLVGRYVARVTPVTVAPMVLGLSVCSGLAFLFAGAGGQEGLTAVRSVLLPQALLDSAIGVAAYWVLAERFRKDDSLV